MPIPLEPSRASAFAQLALQGIDREYPNKPAEVLRGPADIMSPAAMHPAFYGCFDWHSAVHGHWLLVRLLRICPGLPEAAAIRARLAAHLTAAHLATEAAYFEPKDNRGFERMYGWAWALRLAAELRAWDDPDAQAWAKNLAPLERTLVALVRDFLPRLKHPVRTGVHPDTAFALGQILDYARVTGDGGLEQLVAAQVRQYYQADHDYPVNYEPSGEDFLPGPERRGCHAARAAAGGILAVAGRLPPGPAHRPAGQLGPGGGGERSHGRAPHPPGGPESEPRLDPARRALRAGPG